jgi:predicted phage-related endonuclease
MGAWEEARRKGIGGSDWGQTTELGDRCTRALVLDKRGVDPDYPTDVEKQGYFDRGHALEPLICDLAEKELGTRLIKPGPPPKTGLPDWWLGNPDRIVVRGGIFEAKSKGPFPFKSLLRNGPPVGEVLQCTHYGAQYKRDNAIHYALEPVTWKTHPTFLEVDHGLIEDMIVLGERIWKMVTEGPLPPRLDAASSHCQSCPWRWSCQGDALYTAAEIKRTEDGQEIIEVEEGDLLDLQSEILEIKGLKKELADRENEINQQAKAIIGTPQKVLVAGRSVNWYEYDRASFDRARFSKEHPELEKKYVKHKKVEAIRWV